MTCDRYRELISARVDGEIDAPDAERLDAHQASCAGCRAFERQAWDLRRALRIGSVEPPTAVAPARRQDPATSWLRIALFVIGGTLVALNVPAVVFGDGAVNAHLERHDGVFGTALGIAMLAVAAKPYRAIGLVPLTSAVTLLMAGVAIADLIAGRTSLFSEAIHVVEFAGLICLWLVSGGPVRLQARLQTVSAARRRSTVPGWPTA